MTHNLLAISGSLRKGSYNTALLRAFGKAASADTTVTLVDPAEIGALPLFNQDFETPLPASVQKLKDAILAADGILISTPEYNRSMPGVLKNFIDWSTRPSGQQPWGGKPVYVMGASNGKLGTVTAQYDLKRVLTHLDARVLGRPEFFCIRAQELFDADLNLTDEKTKEFIDTAYAAFTAFIDQLQK